MRAASTITPQAPRRRSAPGRRRPHRPTTPIGTGFDREFATVDDKEVFGIAGPQGDPRSQTQPRFQAGLRVTPIETIDFDVIYGRNITGENANWITIGMNVRFPAPGK